jgi:hypothetical protein
MFARMLTAIIGGGIITAALLLLMNYFATLVTARDPVDYFQITDFIPDDRPSWSRMPEQPPTPQRPPERPRIEFDPPEGTPRIDSPIYIPESLPGRPGGADGLRSGGSAPDGRD